MKAAVIQQFGAEDELRYGEAQAPIAGEDELLVRVRAAGVNRGDLGRRAGAYAGGGELPLILGWDIAGTVEALGPGLSDPPPGTRVVARVPRGGYAEFAVAPGAETVPVPESVSFEQAAALPVAYLTAWFALKQQGALREGESCLVQAGASGVGVAAIQIAKTIGARVFTTASSDEKLALARRLGADVAINYETGDFVEEVQRETGGQGVDVVLESVGGEVLSRSFQAPAPADLTDLLRKRASVFGFTLASAQGQGEALAELLGMVSSGKLEAVIDRTFPLREAADAHRYIASRANLGKVLLIP